jgi:iron complex outermembrane receptor protein
MRLAAKLGLGVSAFALAGPAFAAPPEATAAPASVSEIVVTAQRRSELLKDVPLTVVAATGGQLRAAGVTTIRDLGNVVPGYTVGGAGFTAQPAIRGVSTFLSDGQSQSPNALYIDGVYQPLFTALNAELSDIEQVEVLKGPQGTLFGRNATGGAILVTTKSPSFTPHGDFSAAVGAFTGGGGSRSAVNTEVSGFVTGPIVPDLLAASLSGGYRYSPGFLTNDVTGRRDGEIRKDNIRGKLLFTPTSNLSFLLEGHYISFKNFGESPNEPYDAASSAAIDFPGTITPSRPWHVAYNQKNIINLKEYGFSLTGKADFEFGKLTSTTAYENGKITTHTSLNGSFGTPACFVAFACIDYDFNQRTKSFEQELNFVSRDFGPLSFSAGLFYLQINAPSISYIDPEQFPPLGVVSVNYTLHDQSFAAYSEITYKLTDRLRVIGGIRYGVEKEKDTPAPGLPKIKLTDHSFTPRVSVRYDVTDQLNVYATYSQGYKAPLSGATNVGAVPPFAPVEAEKITSYEIGTKFGNRTTSLNLSAFYYDYKNKQEQTINGFVPIVVNTGPVRIYGVDADGTFRLSDSFTLRTGLSWLPQAKYRDFPNASGYSAVHSPLFGGFIPGIGLFAFACPPGAPAGCVATGQTNIDVTGFRLPRAPKLSGSTTLQYDQDLGRGHLDGNLTLSYSTRVYHAINHAQVQPAYALLSAQVGYRFEGSGVHLSLYGRNLTNEKVIHGSIASTTGATKTLGAPREVGLRADYSF